MIHSASRLVVCRLVFRVILCNIFYKLIFCSIRAMIILYYMLLKLFSSSVYLN